MLDDVIDLRRKSKEQINEMLNNRKYDKSEVDNDYKYLVKMPMDSVSTENAERLMKEFEDKKKELEVVQSTPIQRMWLNELTELRVVYNKYKSIREQSMLPDDDANKKKNVIKKKIVVKRK